MQEVSVNTDVRHVLDLGCSTGLSTLELHQAFPEAQITALDLSPYFTAVARHDQQQRQVAMRYMHFSSHILCHHCVVVLMVLHYAFIALTSCLCVTLNR